MELRPYRNPIIHAPCNPGEFVVLSIHRFYRRTIVPDISCSGRRRKYLFIHRSEGFAGAAAARVTKRRMNGRKGEQRKESRLTSGFCLLNGWTLQGKATGGKEQKRVWDPITGTSLEGNGGCNMDRNFNHLHHGAFFPLLSDSSSVLQKEDK